MIPVTSGAEVVGLLLLGGGEGIGEHERDVWLRLATSHGIRDQPGGDG